MMMYARRGNKLCKVTNEDEVQKYLSLGFDIEDENGNVVTENVPNDPNSLKLAYEKHVEEIKALKEENATLKAELEALKAAKATKAPKTEVADAEVSMTTPKKKAKATSEE